MKDAICQFTMFELSNVIGGSKWKLEGGESWEVCRQWIRVVWGRWQGWALTSLRYWKEAWKVSCLLCFPTQKYLQLINYGSPIYVVWLVLTYWRHIRKPMKIVIARVIARVFFSYIEGWNEMDWLGSNGNHSISSTLDSMHISMLYMRMDTWQSQPTP